VFCFDNEKYRHRQKEILPLIKIMAEKWGKRGDFWLFAGIKK
jgi:hypothetical protein